MVVRYMPLAYDIVLTKASLTWINKTIKQLEAIDKNA